MGIRRRVNAQLAGRNRPERRRAAAKGKRRNAVLAGAPLAAASLAAVSLVATPAAHAAPNSQPAAGGPGSQFNLSPASRTVAPVGVFTTTGSVTRQGAAGTNSDLSGQGSSITFDFGKEVGGYVTLGLGPATTAGGTLGLTYSESSTDISTSHSDASNGGSNNEPPDEYQANPGGPVNTATDAPTVPGDSTPPTAASQLRGGFRYLTVVDEGPGTLDLHGVTVQITFAPNMKDLRAYPNYFVSNDNLLNRIWYAGAYTVQTDTVAGNQGRVWGPPAVGWNNSGTIGPANETFLVDGAKRDRTVWPGDMGVAVPTDFVSLGDLPTVRNSLQVLYDRQTADGALPYAGPPVNFTGGISDAYHMWAMIVTQLYVQYSGDQAWAAATYPKYQKALGYVLARIGTDHLYHVTGAADWARTDSGGVNIEANAIAYHTLTTCQALATREGDSSTAANCASTAAALRDAVNSDGYWDPAVGLYRDQPAGTGAALYPQDGNSLAVWYGLTSSDAQASAISHALQTRWTPVGALTPEKSADSVHPFPGSMEVQAHFQAGDANAALDLIRLEWGYMLNAPQGTASTFWEGYRTDGSSDYGGSYMSHAHGWATGPTSALTFYAAGIRPDPDGGSGYTIAPEPGNLRTVQARLTTPNGPITVAWSRDPAHGTFSLRYTAPPATVDTVSVPVTGTETVTVDGHIAWDGHHGLADGARLAGDAVQLTGVPAGAHQITVAPAGAAG